MLSKKIYFLLIVVSAIILCYRAFFNLFPLFFYDSSTYMDAAFNNWLPEERPMIYGLFVKYTSLKKSLWLVIFFQGILLSWLLLYYFRVFVESGNKAILFVAYIIMITFFTSASVSVSQVMPDFFTSVVILCLGLLVLPGELKRIDILAISAILIFAIAVHNSHFLIVFGLLMLLSFFALFKKIRTQSFFPGIRRIVYLWSLLLVTYLSVGILNRSYGGDFTPSRGGHVFILNRLIETGVLEDYLNKNCPEKNYRLCHYKDSIPMDFLWDHWRSPLYKTGGWEKNKEEFNAIIKDVLLTPRYLAIFIVKSLETSLSQFFSFDGGDNTPALGEWWVYPVIKKEYPTQIGEYSTAGQNSSRWLDSSYPNDQQKYIIALSMLILIIILFADVPAKTKFIILFFLLAVYANAFACGVFSGTYPRYQSRVMWLLPLPVFLVLADNGFRMKIKTLFKLLQQK